VSLAEYQRQMLTALTPDSPVRDDPARPIVAGVIVESAQMELTSVCPIVSNLLSFDERLTTEVRIQLQRRDRPLSNHAWGMQFASRLSSDPDPWVSWAALVDAGTLAAAESRRLADPTCPGDPMRAMLLIASGSDPRSV
jgi:hypothetical protein